MKAFIKSFGLLILVTSWLSISAQQNKTVDSTANSIADSSQQVAEQYLIHQKEQQRLDSLITKRLHTELEKEAVDSKRRKQLEDSLHQLAIKDSVRRSEQLE